MKRTIVLDTETTGINSITKIDNNKHKIIEIGAVEIFNRKLTGKEFHCYLNPNRKIEKKAFKVHGITNEFLLNKPSFCDVADNLIKFIKNSNLVIHNASFDIKFLEYELFNINHKIEKINKICNIIDTLKLARNLHPGRKNTLNVLCKRYKIKNINRKFHSAILDAKILSELYIRMTRKQNEINFFDNEEKYIKKSHKKYLKNIIKFADKKEIYLHKKILLKIKKKNKKN
ncbi:DNA polymerase III subunit epsilon [Buchnera aphidicola (Ceratoglyphina bambusae)]|uniref:DNA polymerase III subunit epsilon n=1 Tax=Buchnera aphidicola TaxID=9 RepID=UPI0031B8988E